jgi:hypothetical protein
VVEGIAGRLLKDAMQRATAIPACLYRSTRTTWIKPAAVHDEALDAREPEWLEFLA